MPSSPFPFPVNTRPTRLQCHRGWFNVRQFAVICDDEYHVAVIRRNSQDFALLTRHLRIHSGPHPHQITSSKHVGGRGDCCCSGGDTNTTRFSAPAGIAFAGKRILTISTLSVTRAVLAVAFVAIG